MDVKKDSRLKPFLLFIVILAGVVLAAILFNALTRSETTGPVTTASIPNPNDILIENSSINVWVKTLKTSNGFSLLKSDSYNVLSVWMYSPVSWASGLKKWNVNVVIAGFGATRSGYGLTRANGHKIIWLDVGYGEEDRTYGHGALFNISIAPVFMTLFQVAANSSGIVPAPDFSPKAIAESVDHQTPFSYHSRGLDSRGMYSYPIERWQYSDLLAGDKNDAIFVGDSFSDLEPGRTTELVYYSTFSWGLLDNSRNEIHLKFTLPPDPDTMTPQQLEQNGISTYTYQDNGQNKTGYRLYRINITVE